MSKFLDLRRNFKILWGLALVLAAGIGTFRFVTHNPEWFFPIPTPNGRYHILFFKGSTAVEQGLQSGMTGYLYLPEAEIFQLGPQVLNAKWIPGFFKNWFGKEIKTWEHRFYQQNFNELAAEARGQGDLKVLKVERVSEGYRIAFTCKENPGKNWVETSLKRGEEAIYADSFPVQCTKAREALVQLEGQVLRQEPRVRQMEMNDEVEARIWLKGEGKYLSGDEGITVADPAGPISIIASGSQLVECPDNAEKTCSVPFVRVKAKAAGGSPVVLVGDYRVTLPLQVHSPSASNR